MNIVMFHIVSIMNYFTYFFKSIVIYFNEMIATYKMTFLLCTILFSIIYISYLFIINLMKSIKNANMKIIELKNQKIELLKRQKEIKVHYHNQINEQFKTIDKI